MKRWLALVGTGLVTILAILPATAGAGGGRTRHYDPIPSNSPDSGTCGNDWANDTFDRVYSADTRANADGSYSFREQFKNGTFVTMAGDSPGGCETNPGGTVAAGVTGKMHGSFDIEVTGPFAPGYPDFDAACAAPCYTSSFVAAVYGPGVTYDVPTYSFHYNARDNGQWKNASADRGGNHGDITGNP